MKTLHDIQPFADLFGEQQKARLVADGMNWELHCHNYTISIKMASKYARVDIGGSGRYMVVLETGDIYGIKGYGVIHRGHHFGTLDTIHDWNWSDYWAFRAGKAVQS